MELRLDGGHPWRRTMRQRKDSTMKAFAYSCQGERGFIAAETAAKARYKVWRMACEVRPLVQFADVKVRRAPGGDEIARTDPGKLRYVTAGIETLPDPFEGTDR